MRRGQETSDSYGTARRMPYLMQLGLLAKPVPVGYLDLGRDDSVKVTQIISTDIVTNNIVQAALHKDRIVWTFPGTLTTASNIQIPVFKLERAYNWGLIEADVQTAPTGSGATFRVRDRLTATTIATVTIPAGSTSATAFPAVASSNQASELVMEITAVGSVVRGVTATVVLKEI